MSSIQSASDSLPVVAPKFYNPDYGYSKVKGVPPKFWKPLCLGVYGLSTCGGPCAYLIEALFPVCCCSKPVALGLRWPCSSAGFRDRKDMAVTTSVAGVQSTPPWSNSWERWFTFTTFDGSKIRVELRRKDVCDADLPSLFRHVGFRLQTAGAQTPFALDLSDNSGITDYGVTSCLVPFLRQWPRCFSLKLGRTTIGDMSLQALSDWLSNSSVSEVDLSHLGGSITSKVAVETLQIVVSRRKSLQKSMPDADGKLWFCFELNGLDSVEAQVSHANIWERTCAGWKRRSTCKANKIPVVELALYPLRPQAPLSKHGQEILSILKVNSSSQQCASEPVALSADEFKLYCMECREAAEAGADRKNNETFGAATVADGWSFERNIEANLLLKHADIPSKPFSAPASPPAQAMPLIPLRAQERKLPNGQEKPKNLKHEKIEGKREKKDAKEKKEKKEKREKRADSPENAAKVVVGKAVRTLLKNLSILQASDFRGNVRESRLLLRNSC